eukprot:scaffold93423_cov30-Tisochrysis_lutea.AAC.1
MYKLRFTAATEAELSAAQSDVALLPLLVVDRATQCSLSPPHHSLHQPSQHENEERFHFQPLARESPHSPLLLSPTGWLEDEEALEEEGSEQETTLHPALPRTVERVSVPFYSGQPCAELCAGSLGFYRYESPPGVLGLSPPPLRSSVLAMLNVPASMTSAELLQFIGAYLRCVRYARLVRDSSRPHAHCVLLHFVSPGLAERFRRDFHGRRFNSLEPEVLLAVHVAAIELARPQPPPLAAVRVGVKLVVTTLERGIDGALQPAGTPAGWSPASALEA